MSENDARKVDAEIANLIAETSKVIAETAKLNKETFWYPMALATGLVIAVATITKLVL